MSRIHKETFLQPADDGIPSHHVVQYYENGDPFPHAEYFGNAIDAAEFEKTLTNQTTMENNIMNTHKFSVPKTTIKYLETSRGVAFTADLHHDDVRIGMIENNGNGGNTFCRITNKYRQPLKDACVEACGDAIEPEATFLEGLMDIAEEGTANNT